MPTRTLAWLVTGPLGHLLAAAIDWLRLGRKVLAARVRGREVEW